MADLNIVSSYSVAGSSQSETGAISSMLCRADDYLVMLESPPLAWNENTTITKVQWYG